MKYWFNDLKYMKEFLVGMEERKDYLLHDGFWEKHIGNADSLEVHYCGQMQVGDIVFVYSVDKRDGGYNKNTGVILRGKITKVHSDQKRAFCAITWKASSVLPELSYGVISKETNHKAWNKGTTCAFQVRHPSISKYIENTIKQSTITERRLYIQHLSKRKISVLKPVETLQYERSVELVNLVKQDANYSCLISDTDCISFKDRKGRNYVEVHHIIPMSQQQNTSFNLDCYDNMVALCVVCHTRLHRGNEPKLVDKLLQRYQQARKNDFEKSLIKSNLPCKANDLAKYYGF